MSDEGGFMSTSTTGHGEAVVKRFTAKDVEVEQLEQWASIGSPPWTRYPCGVCFIFTSLIIVKWSSLHIVNISPGFSRVIDVGFRIHPGVGHTALSSPPFQVVNARAGIQDVLQKKDAEEAPRLSDGARWCGKYAEISAKRFRIASTYYSKL